MNVSEKTVNFALNDKMSVLISNKLSGWKYSNLGYSSSSSIDVNPTILLLQLSQVDEGYDV